MPRVLRVDSRRSRPHSTLHEPSRSARARPLSAARYLDAVAAIRDSLGQPRHAWTDQVALIASRNVAPPRIPPVFARAFRRVPRVSACDGVVHPHVFKQFQIHERELIPKLGIGSVSSSATERPSGACWSDRSSKLARRSSRVSGEPEVSAARYTASSPPRSANATASVRLRAPSFARMEVT